MRRTKQPAKTSNIFIILQISQSKKMISFYNWQIVWFPSTVLKLIFNAIPSRTTKFQLIFVRRTSRKTSIRNPFPCRARPCSPFKSPFASSTSFLHRWMIPQRWRRVTNFFNRLRRSFSTPDCLFEQDTLHASVIDVENWHHRCQRSSSWFHVRVKERFLPGSENGFSRMVKCHPGKFRLVMIVFSFACWRA